MILDLESVGGGTSQTEMRGGSFTGVLHTQRENKKM